MPTYAYTCRSCGETFEVKRSFSEGHVERCLTCGSPDLKKIFGNVGIILKGSGFYRTDSRNSTASSVGASRSSSESEKKSDSGSSEGSAE